MSIKQIHFVNQGIYHIFNSGFEKKITFTDRKDLDRFVQILDYYRFDNPPTRFSFRKRLPTNKAKNLPLVEILSYCLMPDHFHLLIKQVQSRGVSVFLSKITNSYTKYFNARHQRTGPLFQGTFKAVKITGDGELIQISRYIHLNPLIHNIVINLKKFTFSSYLEYLGEKEGFCQKQEVLNNFASIKDYEKFIGEAKNLFISDQEGYAKNIKSMDGLLLEARNK